LVPLIEDMRAYGLTWLGGECLIEEPDAEPADADLADAEPADAEHAVVAV
jgi:hypothetical protein